VMYDGTRAARKDWHRTVFAQDPRTETPSDRRVQA
jgi:hypothetical protein